MKLFIVILRSDRSKEVTSFLSPMGYFRECRDHVTPKIWVTAELDEDLHAFVPKIGKNVAEDLRMHFANFKRLDTFPLSVPVFALDLSDRGVIYVNFPVRHQLRHDVTEIILVYREFEEAQQPV